MEKINLFVIHGFLGQPSDWDFVKSFIEKQQPHVQVHVVDLWKDARLQPTHEFSQWAQNFCEFAKQFTGSKILMGYSLGGRLALQALKFSSQTWDQVICLSTSPGFDDQWKSQDPLIGEREKRWIADSEWAHLFQVGPWEQVVKSWNAQSVFGGSKADPQRPQRDYDRNLLGLALTTWSQAVQENLRPLIQENFKKILWIVGAEDEKYCTMTEDLVRWIPELQVLKIANAGHRVFVDQPQAFCELLLKEFKKIKV